jgi:hypothetical protein
VGLKYPTEDLGRYLKTKRNTGMSNHTGKPANQEACCPILAMPAKRKMDPSS